jgi:hypothetical protein
MVTDLSKSIQQNAGGTLGAIRALMVRVENAKPGDMDLELVVYETSALRDMPTAFLPWLDLVEAYALIKLESFVEAEAILKKIISERPVESIFHQLALLLLTDVPA